MNKNTSALDATTVTTSVHRTSQPWLRLPLLLLVVAAAIALLAVTALADSSTREQWSQGGGTVPTPPPVVIYLGFKQSDEIEFDDDTQDDFVYKNEDIVAFEPSSGQFSIFFDGSACGLADANLDDFEILDTGNLLFTLRAGFTIPGLGEVDDADVIEYTPDGAGCGTFAFYLVGADVGLTKGAEDIDALGIAADGNLLISTIGTANVPGGAGEITVKDQDLVKFDPATGTWSLYFDGSDVELTDSSEDIRSVSVDRGGDEAGNQNLFLTLSGDFDVESANEDEGDKNDVEGCTPLGLGESTECFFFELFDGEEVNAENQLDGLAVVFGASRVAASATADSAAISPVEAEAESDAADFAETVAENDSEVTADDFIEVVSRLYLPLLQR
ncbi:MAG: hypothetical protein M3Q45_03055 [Chloroflexota bacterium]|nr:hypothetical protein [Chloroflexota bacterium]